MTINVQDSVYTPGHECVWFNSAGQLCSRVFRPEALVLVQAQKIPKRIAWIFHNVVAHPLLGFFPCRATTALHDWSGEKMQTDEPA
jgi:hypothetical protein